MSDAQASRPRNLPILLCVAMLAHAVWLTWLVGTHAILITSDAGCFKQPAYMRLFTPNFSIPSYEGRGPYFDEVNSYPAAVYVYTNYVTFKLFGYTDIVSNTFDLAVHWLLTSIAAWTIWRVTRQQMGAIVLIACSPQWLLPVGRPEELGMLFVVLGVLAICRAGWGLWAAVACLGCVGATSPGAAIVGTLLLTTFDLLNHKFQPGTRWRQIMLLTIPPAISIGIYVAYTWPYTWDAWRQHQVLEETLYVTQPLSSIVHNRPPWAVSTLGPIFGSIILVLYGVSRRPTWFPLGTSLGNFAIAAAVTIAAGLAFNFVLARLDYDYRHITMLSISVLALATNWLPAGSARQWAVAIGLWLISLPQQRDIVRFTLAPLAREEESVSFDEAKRTLYEVIPSDGAIGGDGSTFMLLDDGRPYLLTRMVGDDDWPDYIVSRSWYREPAVAYSERVAHRLDTEYEEITPEPHLTSDGCGVHIFGWTIPIAHGRCDWYLRIWKRREPVGPPAAQVVP
jgi:hypothetical protein